MRAGRFIRPNFQVVVTDGGENEEKWVMQADSEEALRRRLEEEGWSVKSVQPYDFDTWVADSERLLAEVERVLEEGEKPKYSSKHWQRLKRHLFELFRGRCAYCESTTLHVSSGDVEHYRPKARVDEDPAHPGYYWLAYDFENLLPACERCNRARGKMNRFPVEEGTRATDPTGIEAERPLLLNPYLDASPLKHLHFTKTGYVKERTKKGEASIKVYNLNRPDLRRQREEAFNVLARNLEVAFIQEDRKDRVGAVVEKLRAGESEYSSALLSCVSIWLEERMGEIADLRQGLPT